MKKTSAKIATAILGFPAALLGLGVAWSMVDIFALGNWDGKFGRWGTFELTLSFLAYLTVAAAVGNALLVLLVYRRLRTWTARRIIAASALGAATTITLLRLTEISTIADPLVSLVGGRNETVVYAALLGGVPCVVMATIFLILGMTLRKGSSFDI